MFGRTMFNLNYLIMENLFGIIGIVLATILNVLMLIMLIRSFMFMQPFFIVCMIIMQLLCVLVEYYTIEEYKNQN